MQMILNLKLTHIKFSRLFSTNLRFWRPLYAESSYQKYLGCLLVTIKKNRFKYDAML